MAQLALNKNLSAIEHCTMELIKDAPGEAMKLSEEVALQCTGQQGVYSHNFPRVEPSQFAFWLPKNINWGPIEQHTQLLVWCISYKLDKLLTTASQGQITGQQLWAVWALEKLRQKIIDGSVLVQIASLTNDQLPLRPTAKNSFNTRYTNLLTNLTDRKTKLRQGLVDGIKPLRQWESKICKQYSLPPTVEADIRRRAIGEDCIAESTHRCRAQFKNVARQLVNLDSLSTIAAYSAAHFCNDGSAISNRSISCKIEPKLEHPFTA